MHDSINNLLKDKHTKISTINLKTYEENKDYTVLKITNKNLN